MFAAVKTECTIGLDELEVEVAKVRSARSNRKATGGEQKLDDAVSVAHAVRVRVYKLVVEKGTTEERARLASLLTNRMLKKG